MALKDTYGWQAEPLYLIDGTSFLYRAFYAFPDLARSDGFPTNALYIMLRIILRLQREESPSYCCFLLDGHGKTFRHEIMAEYKAQRLAMPEPLNQQIEPLIQGIELLGLPYLVTESGEADDYIASLAERFKSRRPVVILGSDKDLYQCLDRNVILWDPGQRAEKTVTLQQFREDTGLDPGLWPDYLALVGDKSDNIPGVPGIGPKTARSLLQRYPGLESLREHADQLPDKDRRKLEPYLDNVFRYRELTRLRTDFLPGSGIEDFRCETAQRSGLETFFRQYEFSTMLREVDATTDRGGRNAEQRPRRPRNETRGLRDLPCLDGREVGLAPSEQGGLCIGLDEEEYLGPFPARDLVDALQSCSLVHVPSWKELLESDPAWEDLSLQRCFDLGLAAYLLNPEERDYGWERVLKAYLPEIDTHIDNPGIAALRIGRLLRQRLETAALLELKYRIELPLVPVLVRMQARGVPIDLEAFRAFLQEVESEIRERTERIFQWAGGEFNIRSSQQLAEVLFGRLGLKPGRKTPGGLPSTAGGVLESLQNQHPIVGEILQFRSLEKLRSTYLQPLPMLVGGDGRLHTRFNNLATATGRLSSSGPNLQNIPVRGEFGPRMRSCFSAPQGSLLVAADYSQIELRLLAHMSEDPNLLEAFSKGEDIHRRTAGLLFDKPQEEISLEERRKAKTINFGLLYGMGPQKLGRETGLGMQKAKEFIAKYFERLEGVSRFFTSVETGARERGYVTTLAGRRRLLQDIHSRNQNLAQQARRLAINTVVQGSAADIIKIAMIRVENDPRVRDLGAGLILQVHDELLVESPQECASEVGSVVAEIMSGVTDLSVPLQVDWGTGRTWAEAH
jgi:DNA polymerase-1